MAGHITGHPWEWERGGNNSPHITRYYLARGWIMPDETVLDAACCTGYGSRLLALSAKKVIGYEIDSGCIEEANQFCYGTNIEYHIKDLDTCELPDVDVAVSIETIEHLNDMHHFARQLKKHVKRCIIVCAPIGGTSFEYKNEKSSPATEKNDFMKIDDLIKIFQDDVWKEFNSFHYGYSGFVIMYKKSPENPYEKNIYSREK